MTSCVALSLTAEATEAKIKK